MASRCGEDSRERGRVERRPSSRSGKQAPSTGGAEARRHSVRYLEPELARRLEPTVARAPRARQLADSATIRPICAITRPRRRTTSRSRSGTALERVNGSPVDFLEDAGESRVLVPRIHRAMVSTSPSSHRKHCEVVGQAPARERPSLTMRVHERLRASCARPGPGRSSRPIVAFASTARHDRGYSRRRGSGALRRPIMRCV